MVCVSANLVRMGYKMAQKLVWIVDETVQWLGVATSGTVADDCDSDVCVMGLCAVAQCGDGVVNGDDICDDGKHKSR